MTIWHEIIVEMSENDKFISFHVLNNCAVRFETSCQDNLREIFISHFSENNTIDFSHVQGLCCSVLQEIYFL